MNHDAADRRAPARSSDTPPPRTRGAVFCRLAGLTLALLLAVPAGAQSFTDLLKSVAGHVKGADTVQNVLQQLSSITTPTLAKRDDTLGVAAGDQVVFYSASWCGYCKQAREYMRSKNVPFAEYDVEKTEKGKADLKALHAAGVPVILIGDQKLMGFQPAQFDSAYARFQSSEHHAAATGAPGVAEPAGTAGVVATADAAGAAGAGFASGSVLTAKIDGVRVYASSAADGAAMFTLAKTDEVVYLGEARDGYIKVQGAGGAGWVQSLLMKK